ADEVTGGEDSSCPVGRSTLTSRSIRSSRGPLSRRRWRRRSASAAALTDPRKAAGTRVGRGHEHELRWEDERALATHDRHAPVLQRLAQRLEARALELRELVEEKHAAMGESSGMFPAQCAACY